MVVVVVVVVAVIIMMRAIIPRIVTGVLESAARLAQSVERKALNLVVVGSSPTVGVFVSSPTVVVIQAIASLIIAAGVAVLEALPPKTAW